MATIKLAEALLRRKELEAKVKQVQDFRVADMYEIRQKRVKVTDNIDDLTLTVPKLSLKEVTAEHDYYAKQLRKIDAVIQQANWTTDVDVGDTMKDFDTRD